SADLASPTRSPRPSCFSPATMQATSQERNCLWMAASRKCRLLDGGARDVRGRRATVQTRACSAERPDAGAAVAVSDMQLPWRDHLLSSLLSDWKSSTCHRYRQPYLGDVRFHHWLLWTTSNEYPS